MPHPSMLLCNLGLPLIFSPHCCHCLHSFPVPCFFLSLFHLYHRNVSPTRKLQTGTQLLKAAEHAMNLNSPLLHTHKNLAQTLLLQVFVLHRARHGESTGLPNNEHLFYLPIMRFKPHKATKALVDPIQKCTE